VQRVVFTLEMFLAMESFSLIHQHLLLGRGIASMVLHLFSSLQMVEKMFMVIPPLKEKRSKRQVS